MTPERFEQMLKATLEDFRLSRGEKRALRDELREIKTDERELAVFRHRAFAVAREELITPTAHNVLDWLEEVNKMLQRTEDGEKTTPPSEAYFSPDDEPAAKIISLLRSAQKSIDICVFTITDDRITEAILDAHRRGVSLRIITDDEKAEDRGSDIERLERAGMPLRLDRTHHHMHHKFALFDDRRMLTGSYNWTRSAAKYNEENLIVTYDRRLVEAFSKQFERLWDRLS